MNTNKTVLTAAFAYIEMEVSIMKKLRVCTGVIPRFKSDDVTENIRLGFDFQKKMGFEALDFELNRYTHLLGEGVKAATEFALEYSQKIGLPIEICHLPFRTDAQGEPDDHFFTRMYHAIDCAKMLGVSCAAIHPDSSALPVEGYDIRKQHERSIRLLTPSVEYANKNGVQLAVENMRPLFLEVPTHRYCQTAEELCAVADEMGIGVCWDFGHANIAALQQSEALTYVGKRLKLIHINDNHGIQDVHLLPWTGTVDWADAMKGLAATGYDGPFNFELSSHRVPLEMCETFATYVLQSSEKLQALMD